MRRHFWLALVLVLGPLWPSEASCRELQIGLAAVDITPPIGFRMRGYFVERLATGVHDPLHAKAIVLRQGETRAALVLCDLCSISADVTGRARKLAEQLTGIAAQNIVVAATHTHTGPDYDSARRLEQHRRAVARHGRDPQETVDYPAVLAQRIAEAIHQADRAAAPARLRVGVATQEGLAFNRRFHMKDGSVRTNPGKQNPDVVRPAGPIDPELSMLMVHRSGQDSPAGGLTVFAMHLDTVGGTQFSADYPFHLEQALQRQWGAEFISIFGIGTCGDINHIDVASDRPQRSGQEQAQAIGQALAATVLSAQPALLEIQRPSLAMQRTMISVPLQRIDAERLAQARKTIQDQNSVPWLDRVDAYKVLEIEMRGAPPSLAMEVQALKLDDDTALVALPGEVFVELGLAIRRASPFRRTIILELANDCPAYIPTRRAFEEGGYETVNSYIQPGGGEQLAEAAVQLLGRLKPRPLKD